MSTSPLHPPTLAPQVLMQVSTHGLTPTLHRTLRKCRSCGGHGQMPPCFMVSQPRGCGWSFIKMVGASLPGMGQSKWVRVRVSWVNSLAAEIDHRHLQGLAPLPPGTRLVVPGPPMVLHGFPPSLFPFLFLCHSFPLFSPSLCRGWAVGSWPTPIHKWDVWTQTTDPFNTCLCEVLAWLLLPGRHVQGKRCLGLRIPLSGVQQGTVCCLTHRGVWSDARGPLSATPLLL